MYEAFYSKEILYVPKYPKWIYGNEFKKLGYYENWVIFACLLQAHPYIKSYLARKQEGKCIFCGKKLFDDMNYNIVHHREYLNMCSQHNSKDELIRVKKPIRKNANRTIPVPNCEYCKRHSIEAFNDCVDCLVVLHDVCHMKLHYSEQTFSNNKPIKYVKSVSEILSHNPELRRKATKKRLNKPRICKRCGESMILRNGKYGVFFGCTMYPQCNYTEQI